LGHDVLTVQESENRANADPQVLAFATAENRAVITLNRKDFFKLHRLNSEDGGITACSDDRHRERLAQNIHDGIKDLDSLVGKEIRIYKPG
jgi:Domain of unknown function (DUF5615)